MASLIDSRRLTGPNLAWDRPGAVLDVALEPQEAEPAIAAWREAVGRMLDAVGWAEEECRVRRFGGGASLVISAPDDVLYAATEVNEYAWAAAEAALAGTVAPGFSGEAARLRGLIVKEQRPAIRTLAQAALERSVTCLRDDDAVSVGTGAGAMTWPVDRVPEPGEVPWDTVFDVPVVLITGSNGKTTSVRLLAAVVKAAGMTAGSTSTDAIRVGGDVVEEGDWAGPGGARRVLRDRRVQVAILETARGGILRRGLAVRRATACLVTNVAADHLGEFGIRSVADVAQAKLVVARALDPARGLLILNADDASLVAAADGLAVRRCYISAEAENPIVRSHRSTGGMAAVLAGGELRLCDGTGATLVTTVDRVPLTLGGLARYNVRNALGVIAMARTIGISPEAIASGLAGFHPTREDNPGRLNIFDLGGVTAIVDFAHNPHGMAALGDLAAAMPARRRLLLIGQAGDRDDDSIRELARAGWALRPDAVVIKEMVKYLRGREPGEIPELITGALRAAGAPADVLHRTESELAGVRLALAWARPGDLLLLTTHESRDEVLALLEDLAGMGWTPGAVLPAAPPVGT